MCVCRLFQMIEPVDVFWKCNKGYLCIVHSLPNGDVLISNMGDPAGNGKGTFSCNQSDKVIATRRITSLDPADFQS